MYLFKDQDENREWTLHEEASWSLCNAVIICKVTLAIASYSNSIIFMVTYMIVMCYSENQRRSESMQQVLKVTPGASNQVLVKYRPVAVGVAWHCHLGVPPKSTTEGVAIVPFFSAILQYTVSSSSFPHYWADWITCNTYLQPFCCIPTWRFFARIKIATPLYCNRSIATLLLSCGVLLSYFLHAYSWHDNVVKG